MRYRVGFHDSRFRWESLAASRFVDGTEKCRCSHLKGLKADLANALALQQAFRNKIPELQKMSKDDAFSEYAAFAREVGRKTTRPPGYSGPASVEFTPFGDGLDDESLNHYSADKLCERTQGCRLELEDGERGSICEAMARGIRAHEDFHQQLCKSIGYRAYGYRFMHPADRAKEEVDAYEVQIQVLRDAIKKLSLSCRVYKATGQDGPTTYSGVICSLEKPFTVTVTHPLYQVNLQFTPDSATSGRAQYAGSASMMSMSGGGPYKVEGVDTDKPRILLQLESVASIPTVTTSGGGTAHIDLVPIENAKECQPKE